MTINNLLPGAFDTDRLQGHHGRRGEEDRQDDRRRCAQRAQKTIPARRFGTPDEFGATCAFLCSEHAGYITGQNVLIDGGAYPGTY